jgi:hypothetical protein
MSFKIHVRNPVAFLHPGAPAPGAASIASGLIEMGALLEREVKIRTPIGATKLLRGSIFAEPRGNPVREVVVGSTSIYAPVVEAGRNPGKFPPRAPLELWVRRKLGIAEPKQIKSVAFLIARKIAKQGFKGAFMFEGAARGANAQLQMIAEKMGKTIVNDALNGK